MLRNTKIWEIENFGNVGKDGANNPEDPSSIFENLDCGIRIVQNTRNGNLGAWGQYLPKNIK